MRMFTMETGSYYARSLLRAILAGMMIGIGGCVFIGCKNSYEAWVGAILFAVGLCTIFFFGFDLYTGKIGYAVNNKPDYLVYILVVILGNFIGTAILGYIAPDAIQNTATAMMTTKLTNTDYLDVFFKGILCGMLMFIAADYYKKEKKFLAALICVPTFILAGFEHSIADMFYFWAGFIGDTNAFSFGDGILFILVVILGNAVGGILIPLCQKFMYEKKD